MHEEHFAYFEIFIEEILFRPEWPSTSELMNLVTVTATIIVKQIEQLRPANNENSQTWLSFEPNTYLHHRPICRGHGRWFPDALQAVVVDKLMRKRRQRAHGQRRRRRSGRTRRAQFSIQRIVGAAAGLSQVVGASIQSEAWTRSREDRRWSVSFSC
jgi:hypothetical protein